MADGKIAKHGYTVDWGFFNGVCQGADAKPLEHDKTLTDAIIVQLRNQAEQNDQRAADIEAGVVQPRWTKHQWVRNEVTGRSGWENVKVAREQLTDYEAQSCVNSAIYNARNTARHERSHAEMLVKLIAARHGQPLIPAAPQVAPVQEALKAGTKIKRFDKVCEIVELRYQECRGCGPYMNGKNMLHAVLQYPDGRRHAVPARTIRRSAIVA